MRAALISDIHGNREALQVVLQKIGELNVDRVVCLGDVVGYGADPDWCTEAVLKRAAAVIRGNHDKAVAGLMDITYFNDMARDAVFWTRQSMSEDNLVRVRELPAGPLAMDRFLICHGSPMDEDRYIFQLTAARQSFAVMQEDFPMLAVCFFGHTHLPMVIEEDGDAFYPEEEIELQEGRRYLINPGSVGQPRDGNPLASFGVFDDERFAFTLYRVAYPIETTQRKILAAGLPRMLAQRLERGR